MIFIDYIYRQKVVSILKKYAEEASALIGKKGLTYGNVSQLSKGDIKILLSLSKEEWEEWVELKKDCTKLCHTSSMVVREYIQRNFSKNFPNELTLHELRLLMSESKQMWSLLNMQRNQYLEISEKFPNGVQLYQQIHKSCSTQEIIKKEDEVNELQKCYDKSKPYISWVKQQTDFSCETFRDAFKSIESLKDSIISIPFSFPNEFGLTQKMDINIAGVYYFKFTLTNSSLLSDELKCNNERYYEFKSHKRFFKEQFYDEIIAALKELNERYDSNLLVLYVMDNTLNWKRNIYESHYQYLRSKCDENDIQHQELSNYLKIKEVRKNYDAIIIIAMASNERDMSESLSTIIKIYNPKIPRLGYITFLQEMNESEISFLIK